MSDDRTNKLVLMTILGVVALIIAAMAFGPTVGRMAFVILGVYLIGWGVGYYMDTPCPAKKDAKSL